MCQIHVPVRWISNRSKCFTGLVGCFSCSAASGCAAILLMWWIHCFLSLNTSARIPASGDRHQSGGPRTSSSATPPRPSPPQEARPGTLSSPDREEAPRYSSCRLALVPGRLQGFSQSVLLVSVSPAVLLGLLVANQTSFVGKVTGIIII